MGWRWKVKKPVAAGDGGVPNQIINILSVGAQMNAWSLGDISYLCMMTSNLESTYFTWLSYTNVLSRDNRNISVVSTGKATMSRTQCTTVSIVAGGPLL